MEWAWLTARSFTCTNSVVHICLSYRKFAFHIVFYMKLSSLSFNNALKISKLSFASRLCDNKC